MTSPEKYTSETLLSSKRWTEQLFSFRLSRATGFRFAAGQFARLGLDADEGQSEQIWRTYSVVSAANADYLEFFSVVVPGGQFTERLVTRPLGSTVLVEKAPYGFLTTERFLPGESLWMISTGTGLAPFISMLFEKSLWQDYQHLVLVHSVRHASELAYQDEIESVTKLACEEGRRARLHYLPVVTRQQPDAAANAASNLHPEALRARIPTLIDNGELELAAGVALDPARARALLCGNPEMVTTVRQQLSARGFVPPRRGQPGNLTVENYW
jgi:ferredoxin--NADP+ reductase